MKFLSIFTIILFVIPQNRLALLVDRPENCKNVSIHADKTGCHFGNQLHVMIMLNGDEEADKHYELLKKILQPCIDVQGDEVESQLNFVTMDGPMIVNFDEFSRKDFRYIDVSRPIPQSKVESLMLQIIYDYYSGKDPFPVAYLITNNPCDNFRLFYPAIYNETEYAQRLAGAMTSTGLVVKYLWTKPGLFDPNEPGILSCGMNFLRSNATGFFDYEIIDHDDPTIPARYGLCGSSGPNANEKTTTNGPKTSSGGPNLFQIIGIIVVSLIGIIVVFLIIRRIFFPKWAPRFVRRWFTNFSVTILGKAGIEDQVIRNFESTMKKNDYACPDDVPAPRALAGVSIRKSGDNGGYDYPMMT